MPAAPTASAALRKSRRLGRGVVELGMWCTPCPGGRRAPATLIVRSERGLIGDVDAARLALERIPVEVFGAVQLDLAADEGRSVALVSEAVAFGIFRIEDVDDAQLEAMLLLIAGPVAD